MARETWGAWDKFVLVAVIAVGATLFVAGGRSYPWITEERARKLCARMWETGQLAHWDRDLAVAYDIAVGVCTDTIGDEIVIVDRY